MPRKTPDRKLEPFRRGARSLPARKLNGLVDAINRDITGINAPVQVRPPSSGTPVIVLTFVSQYGDYLECEDSGSNTVLVAKQYELRRTPFDGESIGGITYTYASASEREASNGASPLVTETQLITPDYVAGAEIYATKVQGGTGVVTEDSPELPVSYLEINQGRSWAVEEE